MDIMGLFFTNLSEKITSSVIDVYCVPKILSQKQAGRASAMAVCMEISFAEIVNKNPLFGELQLDCEFKKCVL